MSTKKWYGLADLEKRIGTLTFGDCIKGFRMAEEMTQSSCARKLGISRANLCDIEKGRKFTSLARAARMAKTLGAPEELLVQLCFQDMLQSAGLHYKVAIKAA